MSINIEQVLVDAEVALQQGKHSLALELYQSVLNEDPNQATAHYAIGTIAFQSKDFETALSSLNRAAELEPEAVDIAFNLASCLATVGDRLGALLQLQRATQYCQDDPVFVPSIADMSLRLGEPAAAVQLLSRLNQLLPQDQIILARAQGKLGNWREAVGILKRLNDATPKDAEVADKLATAAGKLRDYPTAIAAFGRYLQLVKPTANDYLRYADLLLIAQEADRCDQALDIALEMGEDRPEVHIIKARTARLKGDYDRVKSSLDKALERQPNHGQAWSIKAELAEQDELAEFIQILKTELSQTDQIAALNHRHQTLLNYAMADMCDRNGDYEAASSALAEANTIQCSVQDMVNGGYKPEDTEQSIARAINEFDPEAFAAPVAKIDQATSDITPIFIVGMPRSGTTLVERILGQNKLVFNAGEQEGMEFVAADFWHQLRTNQMPPAKEWSSDHWSKLRAQYLEKLPEIGKPIFTDKLPHNFRNVGLILKMFPDARIIQMHRAIEDVCLSIYSHPFGAGHGYANRWEDLGHFYRQSEKLMAHWSATKSPQILDLNYEDLVQDPDNYAKKLVEFCGFEWNENYLEFHKTVNPSFTFSEIQVRQPIATKRVQRWKNYEQFIPELASL